MCWYPNAKVTKSLLIIPFTWELSMCYVVVTPATIFHTVDTYIRPYLWRVIRQECVLKCRRPGHKYDGRERRGEERRGKRKEERRDYLNTVVSGVSCDPPGGSRWSPLESAGPPQTCPSRRVTYGGHPRAELPPSSLSRLLFGHEGSVK